jgi:hypothetical protein
MDIVEIFTKLRKAFEDDEIKRNVLTPEYYEENIKSGIHSTGFCYYASEVIYRLKGGKENWFFKMIMKNGTMKDILTLLKTLY